MGVRRWSPCARYICGGGSEIVSAPLVPLHLAVRPAKTLLNAKKSKRRHKDAVSGWIRSPTNSSADCRQRFCYRPVVLLLAIPSLASSSLAYPHLPISRLVTAVPSVDDAPADWSTLLLLFLLFLTRRSRNRQPVHTYYSVSVTGS